LLAGTLGLADAVPVLTCEVLRAIHGAAGASFHRIAGVDGAGVQIVTEAGYSPAGSLGSAGCIHGAEIPVVAGDADPGVMNAFQGVLNTAVQGAGVVVVAGKPRSLALPPQAELVKGAGITVIAGSVVGDGKRSTFSCGGVADGLSTRVPGGRTYHGGTRGRHAQVGVRIAGELATAQIGVHGAPRLRAASASRTQGSGHAQSFRAGRVQGALVPVIAGLSFISGKEITPRGGVAQVQGTGIVVVTYDGLHQTDPRQADPGGGAGIVVFTGNPGGGSVGTPLKRIAGILSTGIPVVAVRVQVRVTIAIAVNLVAQLAMQVRPFRIVRSAIRSVSFAVAVDVRVTDISATITVQVFLLRVVGEGAVVLDVGNAVSVHVSDAVSGAGAFGFTQFGLAEVVAARRKAVHRAGGPHLTESTDSIPAVTTVDGAAVLGFAALTDSVSAGGSAVHGAVLWILVQAADGIAAHGTVRRTHEGVLPSLAQPVAAHRHAVYRADSGPLEHLAQPVAAGGRTIHRANLRSFIEPAEAIAAAATVPGAVHGVLPSLADPVAALCQAVLGAIPPAGPGFVDPADPVAAVATVHRAVLRSFIDEALAISTGAEAMGKLRPWKAETAAASSVTRAVVSVVTGLPVVSRPMHTDSLDTSVLCAGVAIFLTGDVQGILKTALRWVTSTLGAGVPVVAFLVVKTGRHEGIGRRSIQIGIGRKVWQRVLRCCIGEDPVPRIRSNLGGIRVSRLIRYGVLCRVVLRGRG